MTEINGWLAQFEKVRIKINEGMRGKRSQVTSDRLQASPCKLLFASFYEQGEFNISSKVT